MLDQIGAHLTAAAGLPDGVLNVVPGGREVGAYLVEHPGVDKVSFTGSSAAVLDQIGAHLTAAGNHVEDTVG
ncbi:hypothetical protein MAHJHV29_49920 [Mycobacterium avium subsp. hominissuis]